jgi:CotH kinase protein
MGTHMRGMISLLIAIAPYGIATGATTITNVRHEPLAPKPDGPVLVTANVSTGATRVVLKLQAVAPGNYTRKTDPTYEKEWVDFPMRDDGLEGDAKAGDGIFSYRVPAAIQKHRWLIRYRIVATGTDGKPVVEPVADSPSPNRAWWVDAGPASWSGSREPGKIPPATYGKEFLATLQSLHLIARAEDVAKSQWDGNFHKQKQAGTIVYRGIVYDHIQYSNRGQGSAHISGKNKWGLKFNNGEDLPLVDHDGIPFPDQLGSLNLNPGGSTPYLPILRGIAGLDEVLSMRSYRLAGVPSPTATWVQWRVVAQAEEGNPKDQYQGDLWGLYVAVGEMTPKLMSDRKLPDGLTVSIQSGVKHSPKDMADGDKIWEKFLAGMRSNPKEAWWRENLDLPAYFSFHAMNRLLGNVDLRPDGNHGYYRHPDGHWAPIPWDNDMMFVPRHHQPGHIEAIACLNHPKIAIEYRNRAREILDLFAADATPGGGQVGQLAYDLSNALTPKGHTVDWPRLDEAVWNQHPRMNQKGSYYVNPVQGDHFGGPWKRTLATNDFAGFRKYVIDFATDSRPKKNYAPNDGDHRGYGWGYLAFEAKDTLIPPTPKVEQLPGKHAYRATENGKADGVLEWRVGRVGKVGWYELAEHWKKDGGVEISIPADILKEPGDYRIRARRRDATGRCSHWSAPVAVRVAE